jgi:uncharacterized protein YtpQ (UPF0354 family)
MIDIEFTAAPEIREELLNPLSGQRAKLPVVYFLNTFDSSESSRLWNLNVRDRMDNHASGSSEIRFLREAHCNTHAGMSDERHRP